MTTFSWPKARRLSPPQVVVFAYKTAKGELVKIMGIAAYEEDEKYTVFLPFKQFPDWYESTECREIIDNALSTVPDEMKELYSHIKVLTPKSNILESMEDQSIDEIIKMLEAEAMTMKKVESVVKSGGFNEGVKKWVSAK